MMSDPKLVRFAPGGSRHRTAVDSWRQSRGWNRIFHLKPRLVHARFWVRNRGLLPHH